MKLVKYLVTGILLVLGAGVAVSAESDLVRYIDRVRSNNPELSAARHRLYAAKEGAAIPVLLPDPQVEVGFPLGKEKRIGEVTLSQGIPWPGLYVNRVSALRLEASAQEYRVKDLENDLLYRLRVAYADMFSAGEKIRLQQENCAILKQAEDLTVTLYTTGKRSQADLLKLQLENAVADDRVAQLQTEGDLARERVAELTALSVDSVYFPTELHVLAIPDSLESALAIAVDMNPAVKVYVQRTAAADKSVAVARAGLVPGFMASVKYGLPMEPGMNGAWFLMGGITIPLWLRPKLAALGQARERALEQQELLAAEKNSLHTKTATMFRSHADAQRQLDLLDKVLVPAAEQVLSVTETAYSAGQLSVLDLIEAQRSLITLRVKRIEQLVRREKIAADIVLCCLGNAQ